MAWLNAKPRPAAGSKRAERFDISKAVTRAAAMRAKGITPQMPPLDLPHMLDWLTEIGLTGSTGMGMAPLSWTEINAWQNATAIRLLPWEARLIRSLSLAYVGEASAAEDEGCPAPWRGVVTEAEKAAELSGLQAVLG